LIWLRDLLAATDGWLLGDGSPDQSFAGFCFDSRRARPGELFVALKTDRGDGHDFVADALARGATGALVEAERWSGRSWNGRLLIGVPDTYEALTRYARALLRQRPLPVVAITGSVGKTTTRAAAAAVLSRRFRVFQNPANFNGRLGVPIALGGLEPDHQLLVLEMGADRFGEIRELCEIAPPRIGIVTTIGEAHLAYFGSQEAIASEKRAVVEALPSDGLAILNRDDPRVWEMRRYTRAEVLAVSADDRWPADGPDHLHPLSRSIAWAIGRAFGLADDAIAEALAALPALPGRMNVLPGVNGIVLVDDSFNASPSAMRAAIVWLMRYRPDQALSRPVQRFLILGDMDQLGEHSIRLHREVGECVARHADAHTTLVTLGEQAYHIALGAREAGMRAESIVVTYLARDAVDYVRAHARAGDCVLVKGDVSARMERVVAALLAHKDDVRRLARQEPGWASVRVLRPSRPTWLDVDLDAIAHNVRAIRTLIGPGVALMAVLKADGYGHGAVKVARTALNNGADWCGVASLSEATALRSMGIEAPILILGFTPAWHAREALLRDVALTAYDLDVARAYSRAAQELKRTARLHVKVDTGMSRLGVLPAEAPDFIRTVAALPAVCVEGVFTHFSSADSNEDYTRLQLARFRGVLSALGNSPTLRYIHAANSAATLAYPEARFNMVRIGLAMYGLNPFHPLPLRPSGLTLRPAMTWRTTIAQVKTLPAGTPVSYGGRFICPRETTIAVIPVGYADGFRRAPQTFGEVLVRGQRAPIIGAVCMDQTILDVSHIPGVRIGDEVMIIGRQGDAQITVEEAAARLGTISYEVISAILPRVPRVS